MTETGSARDREETRETAFNYLPTGVKDGSFAPASSTPVSQLPPSPQLPLFFQRFFRYPHFPLAVSPVSFALTYESISPYPSLLSFHVSFSLFTGENKFTMEGGRERSLLFLPLLPSPTAHRSTSSRPRLCGALNVTN